MEERHLSLTEVASLMGVSERTVRRWIHSGKLKAYKPGRDYRIPESAVRGFVEESEISPKAQRRSSPEPSLFNGLDDGRRLSVVAHQLLMLGEHLLQTWEAELPERARAGDDEWLGNIAGTWHMLGQINLGVLEELGADRLHDEQKWLARYMDVNTAVHRMNATVRAHSDSDTLPDELLLKTLQTTA